MRLSLALAASSVLLSCRAPARPAAQDPGAPPAGSASRKTPLTQAMLESNARMHERFAATQRMQQAIALSDLARAQSEARLIAELDEPDALPEWQPYVERIQEAARSVIATNDPVAAAATMAILGRRCASCHEAIHAKVEIAREPPPPEDPQLRSTMASHHWATNRMWEGLMAPSFDHWVTGARALEGAPLAITAEVDEPPHGLGIADDVSRIRLLSRRALGAEDLDARAQLFGELLGSCVRCHMTIRDR